MHDPGRRLFGNIFRVTGPLCGNSPVTGEFPAQRPVTRKFDAFFDLRLDKRLSKQSWGWWFETPSHSLWRRGRSCTSLRFRSYDDDNAMKYKQISIIFIMCLSNACCSMALGVTTCCYCIYRFHVKVYVYQMMIIKNAGERKNVLMCHSKTTSVPTLFYRLPTLCSRIYKEKCMSYRELRFLGHVWGDLAMIFTSNEVTSESHWKSHHAWPKNRYAR